MEYLNAYNISNLNYVNWHALKLNEREYIPIENFIDGDKVVIYSFALPYYGLNFNQIDENEKFHIYETNVFENIKVIYDKT